MAYTKVGPFTDGSASPGISAGFLNGLETALVTASPTVATNMSVTSGASFTITVAGFTGGILMIFGTAGSAWSSIWTGVWAADAARVDVTQLAADFTAPGNLIVSVTGSTTSNVVTVATAASGSTALFNYTLLRAGGGAA